MQSYTVYLYLETALHVSGVTSTHHRDRKQLYLQHLVFVTPLLPPAAIEYISNNMQRYTVYFIWKLLYMFRVVPPTHHQERKQLYLQHLVFVTPLLLSAAIAADKRCDKYQML